MLTQLLLSVQVSDLLMNYFIVFFDSMYQTTVFVDLHLLSLGIMCLCLPGFSFLSGGINAGELIFPIGSPCRV